MVVIYFMEYMFDRNIYRYDYGSIISWNLCFEIFIVEFQLSNILSENFIPIKSYLTIIVIKH